MMLAMCRARAAASLSSQTAAMRNARVRASIEPAKLGGSVRRERFATVSRFPVAAVSREVEGEPRGEALDDGEPDAPPAEGIPLPKPEFTKVSTAEFVKSSVELSQCPKANLQCPEFAVIGRSNVGKSSLINMLTNHKGLAMVSKQPGKTKCINHFLINKEIGNKGAWHLVDLPGYGYAKSAKTKRLEWNNFTQDYFLNRESLANVLLLIDASIPPTDIDLSCAEWLADSQVPFSIVFTKTDKRKKKCPSPKQNMEAFEQELLKVWEHLPPVLVTSSEKNEGRLELLNYIASIREFFKQQHS